LGARQINNGMSKYIAEKTVKCMIDHDKKIKNARVLILGVTFKENCPDMRNTKVLDIINELEEFGCQIDIYDPWVDPNEEKKHYTIDICPNPFEKTLRYDAIILAVAHDQFTQLTRSDYEKISTQFPVLIDVKGIIPNPTWRL
jgi:UDP-N-acetyl-D-galactosamine dehydrogenase